MSLETLPLPAPTASDIRDDLDHVTCCEDDNLALCGTDVTDDEWIPAEALTTCVVCAHLEQAAYALDSCVTACPKRWKEAAR